MNRCQRTPSQLKSLTDGPQIDDNDRNVALLRMPPLRSIVFLALVWDSTALADFSGKVIAVSDDAIAVLTNAAAVTPSWLKPKPETAIPLPPTPPGWSKLDNCEFRKDEYHDGDSFHVTVAGSNYQFRLYFVDCPETDKRYDRYKEQSEAFGVDTDRVLEYGEKATDFTERALDKPFTVYTQFHSALGQKNAEPRMYAMIYTAAGANLAEDLVKAGLARVYGEGTDFPDAKGRKKLYLGLDEQAKKARADGIGIYRRKAVPK